MKYILTGSIACGKSTIASMWKQLNPEMVFIDYDKIVGEMYLDQSFAYSMEKEFATSNKSVISDLFHSNKSAKAFVEQSSAGYLSKKVNDLWMKHDNVVLDCAIFPMIEHWLSIPPEKIVVAWCNKEKQHERIVARNQWNDAKVDVVIQSLNVMQTEMLQRADIIIDTDCSIDDLLLKVAEIEVKE